MTHAGLLLYPEDAMAKKHYRTVSQHFWDYAQHTLLICWVFFGILFLLLMLCVLGHVNLLLFLLGGIAFLLLVWGLTLLRGLRFLLLIRRQTRQGLPFEAGPLQRLDALYTSSWLSANWLIHAGYVALHRSQIADMTYDIPRGNRIPTGVFSLIITTVHGRRYRCRMTGASVKKVMKWHQKNAARKDSPC